MTTSKLFIAAVTAALATPAFAQWQSPAAPEARNLASPVTRDTVADVPSAKSPRPTVIRATKGN